MARCWWRPARTAGRRDAGGLRQANPGPPVAGPLCEAGGAVEPRCQTIRRTPMTEKAHHATVSLAGEPYVAKAGGVTIARSDRAMLLEEVYGEKSYPPVVNRKSTRLNSSH